MDRCHVLLLLSVLQPDKKSALVTEKKLMIIAVFPLLLHPQITLLSTSMMLGLPSASLCSLLCPEWQCSLRLTASLIYESRYVPPERMSAWGRRAEL